MQKRTRRGVLIKNVWWLGILFSSFSMATDSLYTEQKKNYIKPTFFLNTYNTPDKQFIRKDTSKGTYGFRQANIGFYAPLYTSTWTHKDGIAVSTFHLLATGSFQSNRPDFSSIANDPIIYRVSVGLRAIYNTGNKNTWFVNVAPFVANDNHSLSTPTWRRSSMIVFNRTVSDKFSYRIGFIKTYLFGNARSLPLIGFRFGRLDRTYVNLFLPRNISLHFPMGKKVWGTVYTRPNGGLYNVGSSKYHKDSTATQVRFARYEITTGFQVDWRISSSASVFMGTGITRSRNVFLADNSEKDISDKSSFFKGKIQPSGFLTLGVTIKLGNAKSSAENVQMYDVFDLNNMSSPGVIPNAEISSTKKSTVLPSNLQYRDIQELMWDE